MKLSEIQREIIQHDEGPLLVTAGPGSGKTRVLIERIKHLVSLDNRNKVLALTYSNAAANEMKDRLNSEDNIISNFECSTLHSFSMDVIEKYGYLIGIEEFYILEDLNARRRILIEVIRKYYPNRDVEEYKKFVYEVEDKISKRKRYFQPPISTSNEIFEMIYKDYNISLKEQKYIEFDDLLFLCYRIFETNPSVVSIYNRVYSHILVDESQDLNFAQYNILKKLALNADNIMLVGDPKQSIYAFNDSSSEYMTELFVNDFKATTYKMTDNYRSSKKIVEFANNFGQMESKVANYVFTGDVFKKGLQNEVDEAKYIVDKIVDYISNGYEEIMDEITVDDFAIIARNKYGLAAIEEELKERGLNYKHIESSGEDMFSSFEIDLLYRFLRLQVNPNDRVQKELIFDILKKPVNLDDDFYTELSLEGFIDAAYKSVESMNFNECDLIPLLKTLTINLYETDYGMAEEQKYLIMKDISYLEKVWLKYHGTTPKENRELTSFLNKMSMGELREKNNEEGVSLLTAHRSKGTQFEIVFITGLTEGVFPDYRATDVEKLEQEKNVMFVALTRAKKICICTYPKEKVMPWGDIKKQRESRFITNITFE